MIHTLLFLLTVHSVDYYHLNHQFSFHYCNCVYSNILSIVDFNPSFRCYGYHCSHIWVDFWTRTSFVFLLFVCHLLFILLCEEHMGMRKKREWSPNLCNEYEQNDQPQSNKRANFVEFSAQSSVFYTYN